MKRLIITLILLLPVSVLGQAQIDTVTAHNAGSHVNNSTNSYQASREATASLVYSTTAVEIGQELDDTPKWWTYRGCVFFDVSSLGLSSVDSAKIEMYGESSYVATAFTVTGYSYYGSNNTAGYDDFDGWQSGVTDYNGTKLTNDFALGDWANNSYNNVWTLTDAAVDTLAAHLSGSFNVIFLQSRDISGDAEAEFELSLLGWEGDGDSNKPKLIIYSPEVEEEITVTSARGNIIHEARGYVTRTGRDLARKFLNFVKKIGG